MKKIFKVISFILITLILLILFIILGKYLFLAIWDFNIVSKKSYLTFIEFWNKGGIINTPKDCILLLSLAIYPFIWIYCSIKLYKFGFLKFIFYPIIKIYLHLSKPKDTTPVHVNIKNLGSKDLTLDEIIASELKKNGVKKESMSQNLRQQIATKIAENKEE